MRNCKRKYTVLLVCLLLTVAVVVSGTIAYIFTTSETVTNIFHPVTSQIDIPEEMHGTVKQNATVQNTGTVDSFLRARIIVTWQNEKGEVYPVVPNLVTDYTMLNGANWVQNGEYYYYNKIAAPGQPAVTKDTNGNVTYGEGITQEDMLIIKAEAVGKSPAEGYTLHIEILGQSIQSTPSAAVQEAWGMTYTASGDTGTWSAYPPGGTN